MAKTVLVADDNLTIQRMAAEMLSSEGVVVVTVANGVAALKKLPDAKPLVIVADVDMPGKDGYEVCEFIKSTPELRYVRVLLAVSDTDPYDQQRGAEAHPDGIVKKPFEREQLVSMVTECLKQAEALRPPSAGPPLEAATPAPVHQQPEPGEGDALEPATREADPSISESATEWNDLGPGPEPEPSSESLQPSGGSISFEPAAEPSGWEIEPAPEPVSPDPLFSSAIGLSGAEHDENKDQNSPLSFEPLTPFGAQAEPLANDSPWLDSLSNAVQPETLDAQPEHQEESSAAATEEPIGRPLLSFSAMHPDDIGASGLPVMPRDESPFEQLVDSVLADDCSAGSTVSPAPKQNHEATVLPQDSFERPSGPGEAIEWIEAGEASEAAPRLDPGAVADIVRRVIAKVAPPALPADALHELETRITADLLSDLKLT
ncbi:MAG: response regulator [Terriglobia bacterium]